MPTFKIPSQYVPHPHFHVPWAAKTNQGEGEMHHLAHSLHTIGEAIAWGVLIVFGTWMIVALGFALVHVMNFWASPGAP